MRSVLPDLGPARQNAAFRRLLAGGLLSTLGSSMTSFAVVLQIWDLSRSSLDVGLLGLTFVPVLIVGLLGGSAADAVDRRALALVTTACLMAVSAGFAVATALNAPMRPVMVPRRPMSRPTLASDDK